LQRPVGQDPRDILGRQRVKRQTRIDPALVVPVSCPEVSGATPRLRCAVR
jgi:hypothetical protein